MKISKNAKQKQQTTKIRKGETHKPNQNFDLISILAAV